MKDKKNLENITEKFLTKEEIVEKPYVLQTFKQELDQIKNNDLQSFFSNVLLESPLQFQSDKELHKVVKNAFAILHNSLTKQGVQGEARDGILGVLLISKILSNELEGIYKKLYPMAMDAYLKEKKLDKFLPQGLYQNIIVEISGHLGHESAMIEHSATPGSLGYEVYIAYKSAMMTGVTIDREAYYASLED